MKSCMFLFACLFSACWSQVCARFNAYPHEQVRAGRGGLPDLRGNKRQWGSGGGWGGDTGWDRGGGGGDNDWGNNDRGHGNSGDEWNGFGGGFRDNDDPSPSPRPAPAPSPKTTPTPNPPVAQPALTTTARQAPVVANPKPNPAPAPATSPRQVITLSIPSSVSSGITPSVEHAPSDSDVEAVSSDTISDHTDTPFSEADDEVATATETASKLGEVQQPASEISLAGTSTAGDEKDQSAKTSASTDDIKKTMTDSGWYVTSQDFALGSSPSDARISQSRTILWCSFVLLVVSVDVFL